VPHSPEYVPRDHVPVFVPEFEHPEDLVPAEDEAPASLLPPGFLPPRIRPLSPKALGAEMNAIASSLYYSLHPSGTPPLPLLATPRLGCKVGDSSVAAARWPGPTMAHGVDCSYVETRLRDTKRRMMDALELVNLRVSYQRGVTVKVLVKGKLDQCETMPEGPKAVVNAAEGKKENDVKSSACWN
nr:hypothetical protein [Tanacetum cinerariifolium]